MDINNEASVFKVDVAKGLKQLGENIDVVLGKKVENKTVEIKIEDKRHQTININFYLAGSISQVEVEKIAQRVKEVIDTQADIVRTSGDETVLPYLQTGTPTNLAVAGTANAVLIQNTPYIFKGESKPGYIYYPAALPMSVTVVPPTVTTD